MEFPTRTLTYTALLSSMIVVGAGLSLAQPAAQNSDASSSATSASGSAAAVARGLSPAVPVNVDVTYQQLLGADQSPNNWMLYGRTYDNQRFSPLDQINTNNVNSLVPVANIQTGVAASFEVSPIVVNGIMFISTPYDHVMAFDATTRTKSTADTVAFLQRHLR